MVLKLKVTQNQKNLQFESDVISDGTQTDYTVLSVQRLFESDVISDGTQTKNRHVLCIRQFESDVISDGTQTEVI